MVSWDPKKRPDATQILSRLHEAPKYVGSVDPSGNLGEGDRKTPRSYSTPANIELPETGRNEKSSYKRKYKTHSMM